MATTPVDASTYTYGNTTSDLSALMPNYYDRVGLLFTKNKLRFDQFSVKSRNIPKQSGTTVYWYRYLTFPAATTALTEGNSPAARDITAQRINATVACYGDGVAITDLLDLTAIDSVRGKAEVLGEQRGKTVELLYGEEIAENFYTIRSDGDTTYEVSGTCTTAGATTTIIDETSLTQATDFWNGAVVTFTSGSNKGISTLVTDFVADTDTATIAAVPVATASGDTYKITSTYGLANTNASDLLACDRLDLAAAILNKYETPKIDGKWFVSVMSTETDFDVRQDSAWVNANEYAGSERLFSGEIGRWGGIRFVMTSVPFRSTAKTPGTYAATGAVFSVPVFGAKSYAGVKILGAQDRFIYHAPAQTGDMLERYSTMGWKIFFKPKVLNSLFGVSIQTAGTSIA